MAQQPAAAEKSKPGKGEEVGTQAGDLKPLLRHAKKEPVQVAFALDSGGKAILLVDKRRPGRTLARELKEQADGSKNHRFGTISVTADDPRRAKFAVNKATSGMAKKLIIALRGTGYNKVEISAADGPAESEEGPSDDTPVDGEDEKAEDEKGGAAAASRKIDTGKLVAELTPLVRESLDLSAKDPALKASLGKLAAAAQTSLRRAMLSLAPKELEQARDDIDAFHDAVEEAREGHAVSQAGAATGAAAAAAAAGALAPQQVTQHVTAVVHQATEAMRNAPEHAAQLKLHVTAAHAALKAGHFQEANAHAEKLGQVLGQIGAGAMGGAGQPAPAKLEHKPEHKPGHPEHHDVFHKLAQDWERKYEQARNEAHQVVEHFRKSFEGHGHAKHLISEFERVVEFGIGLGAPAIPLARHLYHLAETHKEQLAKGVAEGRAIVKRHIEHITANPFLAEIERNPFVPTKMRQHLVNGLKDVMTGLAKH